MYIVYDPNHNIKLLTDDPEKALAGIQQNCARGETVGISEKYPNTFFTSAGVYTIRLVDVNTWMD